MLEIKALLGKELDPRHISAVSHPVAELQNPGVSTGPGGKPWPNLPEEKTKSLPVFDSPLDQTPRVQVTPTRQRNELLGKGTQLLGLGLGRNHPTMGKKAGCHVVQHGSLVSRGAGKLAALGAVPH